MVTLYYTITVTQLDGHTILYYTILYSNTVTWSHYTILYYTI